MPNVVFADPTTTMDANTRKVLSILPPIEEEARPPSVTPVAPIPRPIDNHAAPHNTPRIQQQIQETAQPYRPNQHYDDLPSGGLVGSANTLRTVPLTNGQAYAQDEAAAALAFAAGLAISGFYDGITKAFSDEQVDQLASDPDLGAPYYFGNKLGDKVRDIADNPPRFDIPRLQIPKIELPHIPEFKFPELPEFKIPEFKFPEPQDKDRPNPNPKIEQPKPIPSDLTRQLRELDLSECGEISFSVVYAYKLMGFRWVENAEIGAYQERVIESSSLDEVISHVPRYIEEPIVWAVSGGGDGSIVKQNLGNGVTYDLRFQGSNRINNDGSSPGDSYRYPVYTAYAYSATVTGLKNKTAINAVLDHMSSGIPSSKVYAIAVSQKDARFCPLGKPDPPPDDPPPPPEPPEPPMCCPAIDYRKIKAMIDDAISKLDLVAAIPMSWQIRNEGGKPQLIIQCAEENGVDAKGNKKYKSAMYPISVPHWDGTASDKISLPSYIKGNYEGIYTLNDNSKVTINTLNEIECKKILNAIKPHIPKQFTTDAYFKGGVIVRDKPIKESRVKPRYGRYFKDGQKNNKPDWRVDFT